MPNEKKKAVIKSKRSDDAFSDNDSLLLKAALVAEQNANPSEGSRPQKTLIAVPMKINAPQIDIDIPHVSKTSQTNVSSEVEFKTNADKLKVPIAADVPNKKEKRVNNEEKPLEFVFKPNRPSQKISADPQIEKISTVKKENTLQKASDVSKSHKKLTSSKTSLNLQTQAATTSKRKVAENSQDIQRQDKPEMALQSIEMLLRQCSSSLDSFSKTQSSMKQSAKTKAGQKADNTEKK